MLVNIFLHGLENEHKVFLAKPLLTGRLNKKTAKQHSLALSQHKSSLTVGK